MPSTARRCESAVFENPRRLLIGTSRTSTTTWTLASTKASTHSSSPRPSYPSVQTALNALPRFCCLLASISHTPNQSLATIQPSRPRQTGSSGGGSHAILGIEPRPQIPDSGNQASTVSVRWFHERILATSCPILFSRSMCFQFSVVRRLAAWRAPLFLSNLLLPFASQ